MPSSAPAASLRISDFLQVDIRAGTVLAATPHPSARKPAFVLQIDFGPLGVKTSSAQITEHYAPDDLIGRQVIAVVNFPPKRIAGVISEVLVLAAVDEAAGTILLAPERPVPNGARVA